jgi:predicted TIM-barrel fold metal-dependent hydrolase
LSMIIDAHTHIFPPEVVENRERFLTGEPAFASIYSDPKAPMVTAEGLIQAMDAEGVDQSWALGFPWVKEANARLHNAYLASVIKEYPERLRALGCVHPVAAWAQVEASRCLAAGLHGLGEIAFYSTDLNIRALGPLCDLCALADKPLLLHTNEPVGHRYPGKAPMTLASLYGLIKAHPRTKLVLAHMAGGLFFYALLKKEVSQALRNVWIDTAAAPFLYQPKAYALAVEFLGADKVLLGSDYPLLPVSRYKKEMAEAGISQSDLEAVMGNNAAQLIA